MLSAVKMITLEQLTKQIIHLRFASKHLMNASLMRPQEYHESKLPMIKGKIFSMADLMDEHVRVLGEFNYLDEVHGMNFPGEVLIPFFAGKFDPLSTSEAESLRILKEMSAEKKYVIATFRDNEFRHEFAHALYETNSSYRRKVQSILKTLSVKKRNKIEDYLRGMEYPIETWKTEMNSYLVDKAMEFKPQTEQICNLYNQYSRRNGNGHNQ